MTSKGKRLIFALLFLGLSPGFAYGQDVFQISANAVIVNGKPWLHFAMKNTSGADITIRKAELPWGQRNESIHVEAFVRKDGFELEHISTFDDPEPGQEVIHKGETVTGDVNLNDHLKSVMQLLQGDDLIVFWFYRASTPDGRGLGDYGAWLVFPHIVSK